MCDSLINPIRRYGCGLLFLVSSNYYLEIKKKKKKSGVFYAKTFLRKKEKGQIKRNRNS